MEKAAPVDWDNISSAEKPLKHEEKPLKHKKHSKKHHKGKKHSSKKAKKYVEPSEAEMKALYDDVPMEKGYKDYGDEIIVLPLSLKQFRKLWYTDSGPKYADDYMKEKSEKNIIKKATKWGEPSSDANRKFAGEKCVLERT